MCVRAGKVATGGGASEIYMSLMDQVLWASSSTVRIWGRMI